MTGHNRNPFGMVIPMEVREVAKKEALQAVNDRYPPEKRAVWNLSVIDQVLENPGKYPSLYRLLEGEPVDRQRQTITVLLRQMKFEPEKRTRRCTSNFLIRPSKGAAAV